MAKQHRSEGEGGKRRTSGLTSGEQGGGNILGVEGMANFKGISTRVVAQNIGGSVNENVEVQDDISGKNGIVARYHRTVDRCLQVF